VIGMLSRPDIARLIAARIHLAPLEFVPTEHETEMLASAFATLEQLRNRVVLEAEESDETETDSLLAQLRTARMRAKASEKTADKAAAVLKTLERHGLKLSVRFAEAPTRSAFRSSDALVTVRRLSRVTPTAAWRSQR
jgi:hypothetical protein